MSNYAESYTDGAITYYKERKELEIENSIVKRNDQIGENARKHIEDREEFIEKAIKFEKLREEIELELKEELIQEYNESKEPNARAKVLMKAITLQKNNSIMFSNEEISKMKEELNGPFDKDEKSEIDENANNSNTELTEKKIIEKDEEDSKNKTTEEKVEELFVIIEEISEIQEVLEQDSENNTKFINNCKEAKCINQARANYELELDNYRLEIAKWIVEKNKVVAKREELLLKDIAGAINKGEDLTSLQNDFVELENQIRSLDNNFESRFGTLRGNLERSQNELKSQKDVVRANMAKKGVALNRQRTYVEGVLSTDMVSFPRANGQNLAMQTYYPDVMSTAPEKNENTIVRALVGSEVVTIFTSGNEHSTDTSFVADGVEAANTSIGETNKVLRDKNSSLLRDYPELEEVLDKLNIDASEPSEACDEMEEEQEKRNNAKEQELDEEEELLPGYSNSNGGYYSES